MNMQNTNCCEGCFYAGVIDGYKPECKCRKITEVTVAQAEKVANTNSDDLWDQYAEENEVSVFVATKDRSKSVRRRINKSKANKRAVRLLPVVESNLAKVPVKPSAASAGNIAGKKCISLKRNAKRRYQSEVLIPFPKIQGKNHYGSNFEHITNFFNVWKDAATSKCDKDKFDHEMILACENAIATLDTAKACGGELSSLHREGNVLHVKVGFLDKISMLNFKMKTSSNN